MRETKLKPGSALAVRNRFRPGVISWCLGLLVSFGILALLLRRISLSSLVDVWRRTHWQILVVLPLLALASFALRAQRLRFLTNPRTPTLGYLSACSVGNFLNMLLPARVGDITRCFLLRRRTGTPLAGHLACLVLDRVYDLVAFCLLGAASAAFLVPFVPLGGSGFPRLAILGVGAALLSALLGALVLAVLHPPVWLRRIRVWAAQSGRSRILRALDSFVSPAGRDVKWNCLIAAFLCTVAAVFVDVLGIALLARAVLGNLSAGWAMLLASAFALGIAVPGTPGGLGIHQATSVWLLGLASIDGAHAIAFSLLADSMLIAIVVVMGVGFLAFEGLSLFDATHLARSDVPRIAPLSP